MDDLLDWSWFRGSSFYDFAIKFYSKFRYRPVFEATQYLLYMLIGTDPMKITFFNKIFNSLISLFIYYFVKKVSNSRILAIVVSSFYIVSHLSYFQISQGIGSLESDALLLTLLILYFCIRLIGVGDDKSNIRTKNQNILYVVYISILFFLICFTHERYIGLILPIIIAIFLQKQYDDEILKSNQSFLLFRFLTLFIMMIDVAVIVMLRQISTGRIMPSGTGGTLVEETFTIGSFFMQSISQVLTIFGMNDGPEHLYGIDFNDILDKNIKNAVYISIALIVLVVILYIVNRIKKIKIYNKDEIKKQNATDFIFLSAIMMCIASSSVTIRVEMRFVFVSFTISMIYLSYMTKYIIDSIENKIVKIIPLLIFVGVFVARYPVEMLYRSYFYKIHCFVDAIRVNSLYDITIGKYGVDDILHNKKIYIVNKYYGMTKFYAEYIYKIYDKENVGNTINLLKDFDEIPLDVIDKNTIIIYEDIENNKYAILDL